VILFFIVNINCSPLSSSLSSSSLSPSASTPAQPSLSSTSVLTVSLILGLVFIVVYLQMMRLREQQGLQQGGLSDQESLRLFYNKLTVSNLKDKIKTEADALRYCQASGILSTKNTTPSLLSKTH
jgi:hypothetical protein